MHPSPYKTVSVPDTFRLNMQILADALLAVYRKVFFYSAGDSPCLDNVRLYREGGTLSPHYVYLAESQSMKTGTILSPDTHWVLTGPLDASLIPSGCTVLIIEDDVTLSEILELLQDLFETYHTWDRRLHLALTGERPLDEMLKASIPIFQNPIFIHDTNFYILAWSHRAPGMLVWDQEPRTGRNIVPLSLIHDFKVDLEYLNTLEAKEPAMYSAEQRGYPILFMNLWNNGHYVGRICVDELETAILPGQYLAIAYLGRLIVSHMNNSSLFQFSHGRDLTDFFCACLDGSIQDQTQIQNFLYFLNWKRDSRYVCLRLEADGQDIRMLASAATLGHIETLLPQAHAFLYQNGIAVIVNLSYTNSRISETVSSLSLLLREGLLKMGVSSEFHDFMQFPQGYLQACEALNLGRTGSSTVWYYHFDDYLLEFLLKKSGEVLPPELLCSNKLLILKKYDEKNKTDLYNTLKVYLDLERNVLQTSKQLFIHRSTLFYRLERLEKIADIHLEDPKERLILRISFYILDQNE